MPFHNPAALLWTLLALPIIALYLLKVRRRQVDVSTVMFWQEILSEKQPRALWWQLRHWLSLLLQLIVLGLLILALADPFFAADSRQQRRLVVVLDNSASMQAADGGQSRFETATERLQQQIRGLRAGDRMAVVSAGTAARVVCGLTDHQRTLQAATAALTVTDGPTDMESALSLARRLLMSQPNGRILVFSDLPPAADEDVEQDQSVDWQQVGRAAGNIGITQFQVRRSLQDPLGFQTLIEVSGFSDQATETELQLKLDDELLDVIPLQLTAGGSWNQVLEHTSTDGGILTATIRADDALSVDNQAQAVLPPRKPVSVTLVTSGNWFLQQVLEANDQVRLTVTETLPANRQAGLLILHRPQLSTLPEGPVLVIEPVQDSDLWQLGQPLQQPLVASQDADSRLLEFVNLQNVLLPAAPRILPTAAAEPLVETAEEAALYLRFPRPEGDVLVLAVDLDQTDLPLRTAFPILVANAVAEFSGQQGELSAALSTGQTSRISVPEELAAAGQSAGGQLQLISPSGSRSRVRLTDQAVTVGPLPETGLWQLQPMSSTATAAKRESIPSLQLACNLTSRQESNLQLPASQAATSAPAAAVRAAVPVWFWLTLLAVTLLTVEWILFQRRRIA